MNILSLFDGISCGQIALERAGIKVDNYYASEIDKYAIQVTQKNYPDTEQLGDVTELADMLSGFPKALGDINLVMGGSPCQGFSFAGKQLNFDDPRSKLFFDAVRIINTVKPRYFLIENVKMKKEYQDVITDTLGVEPIEINSALVSAQNRKRLYWTNIPNVEQPADKGIVLQDILEKGVVDRDKSYCIDANYFKGGDLKSYFEKHRRQLVFSKNEMCYVGDPDLKGNESIKRVYHPAGKSPTLTTRGDGSKILVTGGRVVGRKINPETGKRDDYNPDLKAKQRVERRNNGKAGCLTTVQKNSVVIEPEVERWRMLTPKECERLQTVPDNYTFIPWKNRMMSNTQRYKMLGNGWTVDVIAHIFEGIKSGKVKKNLI